MRRVFWVVLVGFMVMPARAADPTGWVHAQFNAFQVAGITMLIQFFGYNSDTHMYSALLNSAVVGDGHWVDPQDGIFNPDDPDDHRVFCEGEPVRIMVHGGVSGVWNGDEFSHAEGVHILEQEWFMEYAVDGEILPLEPSPVRRIRFDPREGRELCFPDHETGEEICFSNWGWGKTFGSEILYPAPGEYEVRWTQNLFHCSFFDFEGAPPWWDLAACGGCEPEVLEDPAHPEPFLCTVRTPFEVLEAEACSP